MGLSKSEVEKLMEKLQNQYVEYSKKYGSKWFNLDSFKERYIMAIENKMNLESFIIAEMDNIDKIIDKIEKKIDKKIIHKENSKTYSEKVDKIVEDNLARIQKYTFIFLHESAGIEISHFYGAIMDFATNYYSILWVIISDQRQKMILDKFDAKLNELAIPRGTNPPKRLQDHVYVISRAYSKEIDIERDKNEYLKESAFLLHEIIDFCEKLNQKKDPNWEEPVKFEKLYIDDDKKQKIIDNFSGMTCSDAILKVKDFAVNIIEDFRLKAFKK